MNRAKRIFGALLGGSIIATALGFAGDRWWEKRKAELPVEPAASVAREDGQTDSVFRNRSTVTHQCLKAVFQIEPKGERLYGEVIDVTEIVFTEDDYHKATRKGELGRFEKAITHLKMPAEDLGP